MQRIREAYGVPAKRGGRIIFDGQPGRILAAGLNGALRLTVLLDNGTRRQVHPTWHMTYLDEKADPNG